MGKRVYPNKRDSIDYRVFGGALQLWMEGKIKKIDIAKRCGVGQPTMDKYWDYWNQQLEEKIYSGEIRELIY